MRLARGVELLSRLDGRDQFAQLRVRAHCREFRIDQDGALFCSKERKRLFIEFPSNSKQFPNCWVFETKSGSARGILRRNQRVVSEVCREVRVRRRRREETRQRGVSVLRSATLWPNPCLMTRVSIPTFLLSAYFAGSQPIAREAHVIAGVSFHHSLNRMPIQVGASNQVGHGVTGPPATRQQALVHIPSRRR